MKKKPGVTAKNGDSRDQRIDAALNQAAMDALEAHRKAGQPLVVWQDGQTKLIPPEVVTVPKNG